MGDTPRIEELRRRVQRDPASVAFAALAEEYRKQGRFEDAIATCTAGLQRHPAYLSAHVTLGRALLEVGRYDEAQEELEHVLRIAPENLAAIRGLAEIHHRRGELPEVHAPFIDEPAGSDSVPAPADEPLAAGPSSPPPAPPPARPAGAPIPVSVGPVGAPERHSMERAPEPPSWRQDAPASAPDPALLALERFLEGIGRARQAGAPGL